MTNGVKVIFARETLKESHVKNGIQICYYSYEHKGEFDMRETSEGSHSSLFVLDYFGFAKLAESLREHTMHL